MRTRDILRQARKDGKRTGEAAASWVFDGNTPQETYQRVLKGLDDGDPAVYDSLRTPNLSGEYADDPTPRTLAEDYDITEERDPDGFLLDKVCTAWEDAASQAFWREIERVCIYQLA